MIRPPSAPRRAPARSGAPELLRVVAKQHSVGLTVDADRFRPHRPVAEGTGTATVVNALTSSVISSRSGVTLTSAAVISAQAGAHSGARVRRDFSSLSRSALGISARAEKPRRRARWQSPKSGRCPGSAARRGQLRGQPKPKRARIASNAASRAMPVNRQSESQKAWRSRSAASVLHRQDPTRSTGVVRNCRFRNPRTGLQQRARRVAPRHR